MKIILLLTLTLGLSSCAATQGFNFTGEISGELKDGTSVGITIRPPRNSNK